MAHTLIAGFHRDEHGDWVAELACGHSQHVRHKPPWQNRVWTQTDEGRAAKLGAAIECPLCDEATPARAKALKIGSDE